MFNQILPTRDMRNMWRTVRRICMWLLGFKGLKINLLNYYSAKIRRATEGRD